MTALDTNILLYSCDQRDPRRREIALDLIHRTTDGVILWQVACEFVAVSRKLADQGFWDAMIVGACLEAGVTRLYSEDLPGRAPPQPVEIVNPFA